LPQILTEELGRTTMLVNAFKKDKIKHEKSLFLED